MIINNKKTRNAIISIMGVGILILVGCNGTDKSEKITEIDTLVQEYKTDNSKQIDVMTELHKLKKDENKKVANKAKESLILIEDISVSKTVYERVIKNTENKSLKDLSKAEKMMYSTQLEEVSEVSEYYEDAQKLISQLGGGSNNSTNNINDPIVVIDRYTRNSAAGLGGLEITLTNTSGMDIAYASLDILEVDKNGNIINSDLTNSSDLFLNNEKLTIKTNFDYQLSKSDLEFRIRDVRYK
ncbi:MAG: hypothetical protein E6248_08935 [Clostridium sp.]|uniref:hypothetical protein n=1 Tax=Clostridium sp. TaxID=1506 RepID=UPI002915BC85|nr:hypothetical protein [Clostridium sp.]MDU5110559.1 hypothetical protein [Clostridium sp.]